MMEILPMFAIGFLAAVAALVGAHIAARVALQGSPQLSRLHQRSLAGI